MCKITEEYKGICSKGNVQNIINNHIVSYIACRLRYSEPD